MLHPNLRDPDRVEALRRKWADDPWLRIEPFLDEKFVADLAAELERSPYVFRAAERSRFNYQYWEHEWEPHRECTHQRCRFSRWLWGEGGQWLQDLTGIPLGPPPRQLTVSTLYRKGCYLDPHSDSDGNRQLAFVLGLTRGPLPVEAGGHLERLVVDGDAVLIGERRTAGWNSLDLFDVRTHALVHRVSLVREPARRRAVSGWFWAPGADAAQV
jgi:hypothetical protein